MNKTRKQHRFLDLGERHEIIKMLDVSTDFGEKPNYSAIARKFNISEKTVRRIRDSKENFELNLEHVADMPCVSKRKKLPISTLLEESLYEWFVQIRAAGQPVSGAIIQEKALILNKELNGSPEFKASGGWLSRFKSRYEIRSCAIQGEKLSSNLEASTDFAVKLSEVMRTKNLKLFQVYNADETGLLWRLLPSNTFVSHQETGASGFKKSKDRVTLMVCANASGTHKVPLFVIGKSEKPRCFKNVNRLPVTYSGQKNAWMTGALFRKWYTEVFLTSVRKYQTEIGESYKVLLILDNAKCHLSKEEINSIDDICSVEFLPPNVTALIQPMDQGVIEKLKKLYRKSLLRDLLLVTESDDLLRFIKERNMFTCCTQIATAWSEITESNLRRAWRKLIPEVEIEAVDSMSLSNDEFRQILYRIPGYNDSTSQEIDEWLQADVNDPGWCILTAQETLKRLQGLLETDFAEQDGDEGMLDDQDENGNSVTVGDIRTESREAFEGFQRFRKWFQGRWECEPEHLIALQKINDLTKDITSTIMQQHPI